MNNKVNARNKWSLSLGCIGRDMCYTLVSLFLLTYLQYTGLFTTSQFLVLTVIIVLCRVWDAVNDPMMGTIITNTKTRFGKYRPWVLIGAVSNSITLVLLFSVRFQTGSWANVVFIGIMYLLWGMTFTMNDISYWDLLPALAVEKKERDGLTTLVAVFASLGAFVSGGLVPIITPGKMVVAYRVISIVCALVFLACQLLVFFGVHDNKEDKFIEPKDESVSEMKEEKVNLAGMAKILVSNKQLMVMAVVVLLYSLGSALLNAFGQNFFYFKFGYLSTDGSLAGGTMMTIFTVIYALGTLISQAVYPMLANKFNRRQLITASIIALVIGYVGFFAMANILKGMLCFIILCIFGVFIFVGQGVFYLVMLVMLTNTIEYGEWQTGKNNAAITFTIRPFMVKLASAIQYGVVAVTLIVCGLYTITSDVGSVEVAIGMIGEGSSKADVISYLASNGLNPTGIELVAEGDLVTFLQSFASGLFECNAGQMLGLTAAMTAVPIVLFVIAYFVYKKHYIIDEQYYEKITKEIEERKVQKANNNE